jgi:hypothetical protein
MIVTELHDTVTLPSATRRLAKWTFLAMTSIVSHGRSWPRLARTPRLPQVSGNSVRAPGPGHSARDRSLSVRPSIAAHNGFLVHSFAGDDSIGCLDYVRARLSMPAFAPQRSPLAAVPNLSAESINANSRMAPASLGTVWPGGPGFEPRLTESESLPRAHGSPPLSDDHDRASLESAKRRGHEGVQVWI